MNDWTWEYDPDAENVVGGLPDRLRTELEQIAQQLADAASVKYIGDPPPESSGVSNMLDFAQGPWMIWYMEHWRRRIVYITAQLNLHA